MTLVTTALRTAVPTQVLILSFKDWLLQPFGLTYLQPPPSPLPSGHTYLLSILEGAHCGAGNALPYLCCVETYQPSCPSSSSGHFSPIQPTVWHPVGNRTDVSQRGVKDQKQRVYRTKFRCGGAVTTMKWGGVLETRGPLGSG